MRILTAAGMLAIVLCGCGNGDGDTTGNTTAAASEAAEVVIQVSGAYTGVFESSGSIFCGKDEFGGPEEGFEVYAMKIPEQFNLRMPRRIAPGTYSMTEGRGAPIDFYYTDPQRVKYDNIDTATVRLESVPQARGERLTGSIKASLKSDDGQTVEVDVRLDLDAGFQSFDECS